MFSVMKQKNLCGNDHDILGKKKNQYSGTSSIRNSYK